jgi:hypothetical protein
MEEQEIKKVAVQAAEEITEEKELAVSFERLRHVDLFNWEFFFEGAGEVVAFYLQVYEDDPPESVRSAIKDTLRKRLDLRKPSS